ncbi:MAG: hypothetical protein PHH51_01065 [Bacilli bacterium]|nr:hypothetical protein [Bacilli bacterium]MDD3895955.1 hypothetical protein [Bacilli bacterium]MDD4407857.1 hypothetical protein [Bacilli bacterium]
MKLNTKGISLVEIIISITLISIIIVFILSVLINIRSEDQESKELSQLKLNQALIIKEIHTDFIERELIGIESCEDGETREDDSVRPYIKTKNNSLNNAKTSRCLKLLYNSAKVEDSVGYLLYYSYFYGDSKELTEDEKIYVTGYRRGDKSIIRETQSAPSEEGLAMVNCLVDLCVVKIKMPILAKNGDDYGINLSYISERGFKASTSISEHYNFKIDKQ